MADERLTRDMLSDATPEDFPVLDMAGNLAEGRGSNLFLVRDGGLLTPGARGVLAGISRQTVIDLAREERLPNSAWTWPTMAA